MATRIAGHGTLAVAVAALAVPACLGAQDGGPEAQVAGPDVEATPPLVGDRPDFTESASVVRRLQLETGYSYEASGRSDLHTVGELLVRVPASRRLELRIGVPSWSWTRVDEGVGAPGPDGVTDPSLGVKVGLRDPGPDGRGPRLALLAGTTVPGGSEVGSDGLHPGGRLAAALDLSERLSVGANAGVASEEDGGNRYAELSGSLSLGVGLTGTVGAYLEGYGFAPTGDGPGSSSVVNGGVTWLAGPDLQLDLRMGTGLSGPSADLLFGTGVVWRP